MRGARTGFGSSRWPYALDGFVSRLARRMRRVAPVVAASLVASVLVGLPSSSAHASDPSVPPGASRVGPTQSRGSAAVQDHTAAAAETDAARSTPLGDPPLPPGAKGVVGQEKRHPDPVKVDGPQCVGCPPGTKPVVQPANGKSPVTNEQPVALKQQPASQRTGGSPHELVEARTATSTTFQNPDGTKTLRLFSGPLFTPDSAGKMVPIDTRVARGADARYRPAAAKDVSIAAVSTDPRLAVLRFADGVEAGFGVADASEVDAVASGSDVRFPGIRKDADLVVSPTAHGTKDVIVLRSVEAPTRWRFPLDLRGLTPALVTGGLVELRDSSGAVRGVIPPGFMVDSALDPKTGMGTMSQGVAYSLGRDGGHWFLDVSLDESWLKATTRRFPVMVDPTIRYQQDEDDWTVSSRDANNTYTGGWGTLDVGGFYSGASTKLDVNAAYVQFFFNRGLLTNAYILEAKLSMYVLWSYSCAPTPMSVYHMTSDWYSTMPFAWTWPGPPFDSANLAGRKSFARGHGCAAGEGFETVDLNKDLMTEWSRGGPLLGFTMRASSTDPNAAKILASYEYAAGGTGGPFLDVRYADEAATYSLPSSKMDPPVTPSTKGWLEVWAHNAGKTTWTPTNGFKLVCIVRNSAGAEVQRTTYPVATSIPNGYTAGFGVQPGPLPAGAYTLHLVMQDGSGRLFDAYHGAPYATVSFQVLPESSPEIVSFHPPNNAQVSTLRPSLWAQYYDADHAPGEPRYWFKVCNGPADAPVGCQETGWIEASAWTVPAGMFRWGVTSHWYVALYDGDNMTFLEGPYYLTPMVAQPEITHHLAGASDDADVPGLNPQVGNYSTESVDASVQVAGPPLEIRRTYNSQDPRRRGASTNLALGRTATSSTPYSTDYGPEKAVNGTITGGVSDKWASAGNPSWLQVDLGVAQTVRSVRLRHAADGGEQASWNTRDFNIQVSTNGSTWTTVSAVTGNTASMTTHAFTPTTARYVKLNVTTPTQDGNPSARIYEMEVYGATPAFGAGWSTPLDQAIIPDPDGSGNVVVTLASGRQVRFGKNPDGTFAPPPGATMTLVRGSDTWTLRDVSGETRVFNNQGNLTTLTDAYGRRQTYTYDTSGRVGKITDVMSGRALWLTWSSSTGQVQTVKLDAADTGGQQPTWSYSYSGGLLTRVCSPLSAQSCVDYETATASHYRSIVVDDNPLAYWPLSEASGGTATNVVARRPGENKATYSNVTLGQAGALSGSPDTAASFNGSTSALNLPDNLVTSTMAFAVEMWFKAASGKTGVLFGEQNASLSSTPTHWSPGLYVGTDGKLYGKFWTPSSGVGSPMVSTARVDNGGWHHVVLSVNLDRQDLYLDGLPVGTPITGQPIHHLDMGKTTVGNGYTKSWSNAGTGYFPFGGQIDDVAVYRHPLGAVQVAAHYAARKSTTRLSRIVEPGTFTAMEATYDVATGRVATLLDRHGATWTVTKPSVGQGTWAVTVSASGRDAVTYVYDADHGSRLMSRLTGAGTETWGYDANSFITKYTDADGREHFYYRDARGNLTWESVFRSGGWVWKNYGYFLNAADPLDPRNDRLIWKSGTRNAWDNDPKRRIWFDIDTAGRTTKVAYPGRAGAPAIPTETFTYTTGTEAAVGGGTVPAGLLKQTTNQLGGVIAYEYSSRGDLVHSTDPLGLVTDYTYDLRGRNRSRTTSAVVNGQAVTYGTWTMTYNTVSAVASETAPRITNTLTGVTHQAVSSYTYDAMGRVTQKTISDATGGDTARTWIYTYDPAGRLRTTTNPDGGVTSQEWNTAGDVAKLTQPNGLVLEYSYDDFRHVTEIAATGTGVDPMDPNATRLVLESRSYDPAGQLASKVDAMGRETAYTYHNDGLLETERRVRRDAQGAVTSSTLLKQYEYDYGGSLIRVTSAGGVVHDFDYDDAGGRNRESLDAGGVARTTIRTFATDGQVATERQSNGFTFVTNRTSEAPYLFADAGSKIDGAGSRYADGTATFTYRFVFPADAVSGTFNLEINNQYLVQFSSDNQNWANVVSETRDIRDGSNRKQWLINLDSRLQSSKTLYVRIGDSQPATGWGAAVSRVAVDYTRSGEKANKTSYEYDTKGNLTRTTIDNPGGTPATLITNTYRDPRGLVSQTVDPTGNDIDFTYDAAGNALTATGAPRTTWSNGISAANQAPVATWSRNTFGDVTETRDPQTGAITRTRYDAMGRPTQVTLPAYTPPGGTTVTPVTTTAYNVDGQPTQVTDPLGRVTANAYNKYGHLASQTLPDPDGDGPQAIPQWRYAYDRNGELLTTTDPTGARTQATYNDLGYQITDTAVERAGDNTYYYTTNMGRDDAGNLTSVETPLHHTTTSTYNKAGEPTEVTQPGGLRLEYRYDALGRPLAEIVGGVRATSFSYDAVGRQVSEASHTVSGGVLSAPVRTTRTSYDAASRPVQLTSAEGRITQYGYDTGSNLTSISQRTDPADPATAITVQLGYDAAGRHSRTVDGNGNATDFLYSDWGLLTTTRDPVTADPNDRSWTTIYDQAGEAVRELAPDGVSRTRSYDALGRLISETGAGTGVATIPRTFDYDPAGRLTRASSPDGDHTYEWNDRGLLTRSTGSLGASTFVYDAEGNLTSRTDPTGTGTFTYNPDGRLATATDALTPRTATFGYDATGLPQSVSYGTGLPSRQFGYDNLGRLTTDTTKQADGTPVLTTSYGYDREDLITSRTTTGYTGGGTNTYRYDGLARLTSWTRPDTAQITYGYDDASNRTTVTGPDGTRTFTYDPGNRLLTATGGGEPDLTNTWSHRGTLETSTLDGQTTHYDNDAFDKPVHVDGPGYTNDYTYDALDRLTQRNGISAGYNDLTNNPIRAPTANGDALIFRTPNGTPLSDKYGTDPGRLLINDPLHGDELGAIGNQTGMLLASRTYTPHGETAATSGHFSTGFQGGWTDPDTGLVNAHARWYDPGQATFTSRDSWTLQPDPVSQTNRYGYGNANPINNADPSGHCGPCVIPIGEALGYLGAAVVSGLAAYATHRYLGSEQGKEQLRALEGLGDAGVTNTINGLKELGASADTIVDNVRMRFADNPNVTRITGPATWTTTTTTTTAPTIDLGLLFNQAIWMANDVLETAAQQARTEALVEELLEQEYQLELLNQLGHGTLRTPPPPISQTLGNPRPIEIPLLPAGQHLQNTVDTTIELTIPAILHTNADSNDAQNQAIVAAAGATAAAAETAGSGGEDPCGGDRPKQIHHYASDKNKTYTPQMEKIAGKYDLDLDQDWNKELLPHLGRHPKKYHEFVLDGMQKAATQAGDDAEKFKELFDKYVKEPVRSNPELLRKSGWC
jgi:RHS repeat-associated protein